MANCQRHRPDSPRNLPRDPDCGTCRVEMRLGAMFADLAPRQPSYRFWSVKGWRFCWTTERMADGKYRAFIYRPVGKGARSGRGVTSWKLVKEVSFKKRSTAKARALKWAEAKRIGA